MIVDQRIGFERLSSRCFSDCRLTMPFWAVQMAGASSSNTPSTFSSYAINVGFESEGSRDLIASNR